MALHELYNSARHTRPADQIVASMAGTRLAHHSDGTCTLSAGMPERVAVMREREVAWGQGYQIMSQRGADEVSMDISVHAHMAAY